MPMPVSEERKNRRAAWAGESEAGSAGSLTEGLSNEEEASGCGVRLAFFQAASLAAFYQCKWSFMPMLALK